MGAFFSDKNILPFYHIDFFPALVKGRKMLTFFDISDEFGIYIWDLPLSTCACGVLSSEALPWNCTTFHPNSDQSIFKGLGPPYGWGGWPR